jgi:dTDP-4-dehydrorhamnose reductase
MKTLLFGRKGQLGWELHRALSPLGNVLAMDYPELDLANPSQAAEVIQAEKPDLVVNATAYTDVEKAEEQMDLANQINGVAPGIMAEVCRQQHCVFIHYSTDYVFNGEKGSPYIETDQPAPINAYGRTKLVGEEAVVRAGGAYLILRTSWVYSLRKGGFVNKVLDWSHKQKNLRIVDDQVGSPTSARMLAEITALLISAYRPDLWSQVFDCHGVYHLAGDGQASRYEWAKAILELSPDKELRITEQVEPAKSSEFPTRVRRPAYSGLDCTRFYSTFNLRLPAWKDALRLALSISD